MAISNGTWNVISEIGGQAINATSTTKQHPLNHRVRARDVGSTDYGEAEFVYLTGVASTALGDLVVFDGSGGTVRSGARAVGPCAVAMSANVASQYGWYQLTGTAKVAAGDTADNAQLYLTATAGTVDDAVVTGDTILGARSAGEDDTGFVLAVINYPHVGDTDNS